MITTQIKFIQNHIKKKSKKEFYLNIDIPTQVVEVPATSAYGSIIIIVLGIICIIISVFAMRKVTNKVI